MQQSRQCNYDYDYYYIIVNNNNIIIFSILFYIFLLGLHSFTIVMFKQATLVFLWMAWKTTTSFRWIWRDILPSSGNVFCVSSSLSLCVFYWFNLCTLERPKCTIHVLSFLISIKNILSNIRCLEDVLLCSGLEEGREGWSILCFWMCVYALSVRSAPEIFLYQLNLMYPVNDLWHLKALQRISSCF